MADAQQTTIHATSIAIRGRAILITGPSGAGKSDLALRLIDRGAMLVSDDYTSVTRSGDRLLASPPPTIAGSMEIRHIGIVQLPYVMMIPVALAIGLEDRPERMPDTPLIIDLLGLAIPRVALAGLEPSAPIKAEWALATFGLAGDTP